MAPNGQIVACKYGRHAADDWAWMCSALRWRLGRIRKAEHWCRTALAQTPENRRIQSWRPASIDVDSNRLSSSWSMVDQVPCNSDGNQGRLVTRQPDQLDARVP